MIEKNCLNCDKLYTVRKYREHTTKYCSRNCLNESNRKELKGHKKGFSEIRICQFCGKKYHVFYSQIKEGRGKYCSLSCANKSPKRKEHCRKSALLAFQKPRKKSVYASPNKDEIKLNKIIQELKLPYKYVGDGKVWVEGKNPDFINTNGQKKIIELFGEPWHGKRDWVNVDYNRTEQGRKEIFSKYGYDTLVIWCRELRDIETVKQRILEFEQTSHTH